MSTSQLNQWLKNATNLKNHPLINKKKMVMNYVMPI